MALGAIAVFGLNIIRLVNLVLVAVRWPDWLDFFHIYVWQTLMVILAFGVFLLWGTWLAGKR